LASVSALEAPPELPQPAIVAVSARLRKMIRERAIYKV